jgi:subtilase family serine protease
VVNGTAPLLAHLPAAQTMHFDIVLALRNQPELNNFLQELYDHKSPSYHQYVTVQEFTERFGPSQEDYDALVQFAAANGFTMIGGSRDAMDVQLTGTVGAIEKAFHVTMNLYQDPTEDRTFYAPDREPSVDLPFQLWHISGLDNYSLPHPLYVKKNFKVKSAAVTGSCPGQSFCGSDMRAAYYESTALTGSGQNIGLLEYAGFDIADVNTYYQNADQTRAFAVTGISTDGTSINCLASQGCDDTEQTIDITQAGGMAPDVTTVYVYVGSTDTALLGGMSSDTPLPLSLSSSWGWSPADPSTDDPYFEKMATQGQTFFQAAGDSGEYKGNALWPANSAYVIAVGGTDLETTGPGGDWASETVWVDGGGGYGTNIDIPSWQVPAADQCNSEKGDCSETYRDVPDVAANANFSFYVCADQEGCTENEYGGTSFAAPMWAGYLALANQQAVTNGVTAPGFIDPTIYSLSFGDGDADFHDITSGMQDPGSPCVTGYNLCGGWGSPNGSLLINYLTQPAGPSFTLSANPSSLSIADGNSGTSTITVTPVDGFSGSVTLSASGLPTGVTAGFSPNPTTSTSTLTLTVGAGVTPGTSTVTISGVSGSLTASTTISLTVTGSGPVVSLNPTSLTWGKKVVGTTSAKKTVVLTNTGSSTLNISTITVTGDFALATVTQTKKVTPCANGLAVPAGGTCEIKVTFTPEQTGLLTGDVLFSDNASGSPQEVSLTGTGKE